VNAIDRYFGITASGSSMRREVRAGATTFLTMAYILFVNPDILSKAITIEGVNVFPQLLTATALAAAIGSLTMGIVAKYPYALAPGMGINAYFTFTVVMGQGIEWRVALGAVFLSGIAFIVLSLVGVRALIVNAIPTCLKVGTAAGVGLFLAIIGAQAAQIVVDHPATLVTLGDLSGASPRLAAFGIFVTAILLARRIPGAILGGIAVTSIIAIVTGAEVYAGNQAFGGIDAVVRAPVWPTDIAGALDVKGALGLGLFGIVFVFLFVDFFDTAGTLLGLSQKAGYTDEKGQLPRASQAFTADAVATTIGALLGTTSTTTYIESAAGIEEGGRTGFTAVVVALFFLLSLFLWPLAGAVPAAATAPALIIVGAMMMSSVGAVDWNDYTEAVPVFLTIVTMPLTYSIANGISFGIIAYVVVNVGAGKARSMHWLLYGLAGLLVVRYVWLAAG